VTNTDYGAGADREDALFENIAAASGDVPFF